MLNRSNTSNEIKTFYAAQLKVSDCHAESIKDSEDRNLRCVDAMDAVSTPGILLLGPLDAIEVSTRCAALCLVVTRANRAGANL